MFYKLVTNGQYNGQDIKNMFYYRTGVGIDVGGLTLGGAEDLAENFRDEVWGPGMSEILPSGYLLQSIDVYPINDTFQLVYSLPYHLAVDEPGKLGTDVVAPSACVNIRFNLENIAGPGLGVPKRGYVAIGPVLEEDFDVNGNLETGVFSNPLSGYNLAASKMSANIESLTPPVIWYPIRVRINRIPVVGGVLWTGYADIVSATIDRRMSWRRSRRPEA